MSTDTAQNNNHIDLNNGSYENGSKIEPLDSELSLYFSYPNLTISKSEVNENTNNGGYISAGFAHSSSSPNFIFGQTKTYKSTNIYFTKLIHNIFPGITEKSNDETDSDGNPLHIGEMVIEHEPINGTNDKLYLCFLLKKKNSNSSPNIDTLIKMVDDDTDDTVNIYIQPELHKNSKAVSYNSMNNKVVVFIKPVFISTDVYDNYISKYDYDFSDKFSGTWDNLPTDPDNISGNYYIHTNGATTNNADILDAAGNYIASDSHQMPINDDYFLDCSPVGASDKDIATYNVPINSEYTKGAEEVETAKTALNFVIYTFIIAASYVVVPAFYKLLIYDKVIKEIDGLKGKATAVRNSDYILILLTMGFFFFFAGTFPTYSGVAIIYGFIGIVVSFLFIQQYKKSSDWTKIIDYSHDELKDFKSFMPVGNISAIFVALWETLIYPIYDGKGVNTWSASIFVVLGLILGLSLGLTGWITENTVNTVAFSLIISVLYFLCGFITFLVSN